MGSLGTLYAQFGIDTSSLKRDADNAGSIVSGMSNSIKSTLVGLAGAMGVALGAQQAIQGIKGLITAAAEEQEVMQRLQTSIELTGTSYTGVQSQVESYLAKMQETTRFEDDQVAGSLQMITTLTGDLAKGLEGSKLAVDIAASGLFDLDSASKYVAMAMEGNVEMLGRWIPQLKSSYGLVNENMSAAQKWAIAQDILNTKFGGMAQKDLETFSGLLQSLKNYISDVREAIGYVILQSLTPKIKEWRDAIIEFIRSGQLKQWAQEIGDAIVKYGGMVKDWAIWMYEHRNYIVAMFIALTTIKAVSILAGIATAMEALAVAITTTNVASNAFAATKLGAILLGGGGSTIAAIAVALGVAGAGWYYIADAAGSASKREKEWADQQKGIAEETKKFWEEQKTFAESAGMSKKTEKIAFPAKGEISKSYLQNLMADLELERKYNKITLDEYKAMLQGILMTTKMTGEQRIELKRKITETEFEIEKGMLDRYETGLAEWNSTYLQWATDRVNQVKEIEQNKYDYLFAQDQISLNDYVTYLQTQLAQYEAYSDRWIEITNKIEEAGIAYRAREIEEWKKTHEFEVGMYQGMGDFAGNVFKGMFDVTKSFEENVKSAFKSFADFVINLLAQMLATFITKKLIELAIFTSTEKAKTAVLAKEVAKRKALEGAFGAVGGWGILGIIAGFLFEKGGYVDLMQTGGMVRKRFAMAEEHEFVMPVPAVQKIGVPALEYMRRTGSVPGGGDVNISVDMGGFSFSGMNKRDTLLVPYDVEDAVVDAVKSAIRKGKLEI